MQYMEYPTKIIIIQLWWMYFVMRTIHKFCMAALMLDQKFVLILRWDPLGLSDALLRNELVQAHNNESQWHYYLKQIKMVWVPWMHTDFKYESQWETVSQGLSDAN